MVLYEASHVTYWQVAVSKGCLAMKGYPRSHSFFVSDLLSHLTCSNLKPPSILPLNSFSQTSQPWEISWLVLLEKHVIKSQGSPGDHQSLPFTCSQGPTSSHIIHSRGLDHCHSGLSPLSCCQLPLTVEKGIRLQLLIRIVLLWALFLIYSIIHVLGLLPTSLDPHPTHFKKTS